jgi:hypothetical protein
MRSFFSGSSEEEEEEEDTYFGYEDEEDQDEDEDEEIDFGTISFEDAMRMGIISFLPQFVMNPVPPRKQKGKEIIVLDDDLPQKPKEPHKEKKSTSIQRQGNDVVEIVPTPEQQVLFLLTFFLSQQYHFLSEQSLCAGVWYLPLPFKSPSRTAMWSCVLPPLHPSFAG